MKKIVFVVLISSIIAAFTTVGVTPSSSNSVRELSGYKLRTQEFSLRDFNLWFVTNQGTFDGTFVPENENVLKPSFDNEWVVGAKVETQANVYNVTFRKAVLHKEVLSIYFGVEREADAKPGGGNVTLATVTKNNTVKAVNFYHGNQLIKSIPVVNVY